MKIEEWDENTQTWKEEKEDIPDTHSLWPMIIATGGLLVGTIVGQMATSFFDRYDQRNE
jgi:hypothetical protein